MYARRARRLLTLTGLVFGAGLMAANVASAHVTVSAPGASSGGSDQVITFRAPTESATASTVALEVKLPTDTPIASVLVAPHPGWTSSVSTVTLSRPIVTDDGDITEAVSTITWKADAAGNGIKPGQFDQFVIIAGQLPQASSLTFPTLQTYSDGTVVSWTEVPAPGSTSEPDHPAPVLPLTGAGRSAATSSATDGSTANGRGEGSGAATAGIVLGSVGVLLGAAALGLVLRRGRRAA